MQMLTEAVLVCFESCWLLYFGEQNHQSDPAQEEAGDRSKKDPQGCSQQVIVLALHLLDFV